MSGPWDKYKKKSGPWDKFKGAASATPAPRVEAPVPPEEPGLEATGELGGYKRALGSALLSGLTLGNSDKFLPDSAGLARDFPLVTIPGKIAGSFGPGGALVKGLGALSKIKGLSTLGQSGVVQGGAGGALEGLLSDPGKDGSRVARAASGAGMGMSLGGAGRVLGEIGKKYDIFKKLQKPGFGDEVRDEIEGALSQLMNRAVKPKKQELNKILSGSDKKIPINPDYLKGFKRDAGLGVDRKKGGLDRLAALLEKRSGGGQADLRPQQVQRLKEYFDKISGYKKAKAYGKDASPKEAGAYNVASLLRGKLADVDPRVGELNKGMSKALRVRENVRARSDTSPISTLTKDPIDSPDRAQEILDLDAMAGTQLAKRGQQISAAQDMQGGDTTFSRSGVLRDIFRATKRGAGSAGSKVDKLPDGTKEALIAKILDSMKKPYSEEE